MEDYDVGDFRGGDCYGPSEASEGSCFIATAAYGSELEPPVQFLRGFRNNVLLPSKFGNIFRHLLSVYYKFSPPIASKMRQNKILKYGLKYTIV